jgi:hypothetical protein
MMLAGGRELSKAQLGHLQMAGELLMLATTAAERRNTLPSAITKPPTLGNTMEEIAE